MDSKAHIGVMGEWEAALYLEKKGHTILERNYRYKRSEIDLITTIGELLVFVEVKTRSHIAFGHPENFVDDRKAAKVMQGAENYLRETDWEGGVRFDVISVLHRQGTFHIEHFQDAFY